MALEARAAPDGGRSSRPIALWVIPVADLGGVARHVLDVVEAGIPGFELVVLCPEGPLVDRLRAVGARLAVGRVGPDAGLSRSIRTLRSAARRLRPAVVHSHLAYADVVVAATPLPPGTVRVTSEHGIAGEDSVYHGSSWKSQLMARVHGARLRRFEGVIAVSEATKQAMLAKWGPKQHVHVVHNGVDRLPPHAVRASDSLRVLALARLSPEKRIPQLIDAFARVHAQRPGARLTIAGVGELDAELRRRVSDLGLADAVDFPGFVDPDAAMAEADVLAQLSVWENCSYSLLDAANRGMRVVASRVGGNPEIVAEAGLVDAEDVAQVARALLDADAVTTLDDWPSVSDMTSAIAGVYAEAGVTSDLPGGLPDHITIATNNGDIGGGEVMLLNIAAVLEELGVDVTIVGPSEPGELVAAARDAGHRVVELEAAGRGSWMLALRRWDAAQRRGVLWCNGLVPAAATAGHPGRIVHLHQRPLGALRVLEPLARFKALTTLVPSASMAAAVGNAAVLPNWSQSPGTRNRVSSGPPIVLGFLGRPSIDKGVDVLAAAVQELEARKPGHYRLLLAGEPRFVSKQAQLAVEKALQPVAHLTDRPGWVAPAAFFDRIDLLVVPSVWPEPFGLVVTEAMAAGVPVLVSDAGALPEIVPPQSGDVFPAGDALALAAAIERKIERGLDGNVDANARRWQDHYSPSAGAASVSELLRLVLVGQPLGKSRSA
ncbi:glycosyltransferase [Pseudoclavibacter sp. VKM Ac-2888]|uniref:glycosyltransferase family 4 protein n=1 Tax=Pseudoclavibacter sp. VKM Ac-2888 TaxID=2783830 RepID=UPI002B273DEB|nr:glycosyltransferase [Pseudoclavibacter sp. VKM Ac-2888]